MTAFLMGSKRLYHFVDDNPMVEMRAVDFTNDTHVIRSFSRMVAINSAIEVDLTGQVCADSSGTASTVASAARWTSSAVRPRLRKARPSSPSRRPPPVGRAPGSWRPLPPAPASSTRAHVRTVVTEWGVAELFGKSTRERAEALIAIAHPDHRDALRAEARSTHEL